MKYWLAAAACAAQTVGTATSAQAADLQRDTSSAGSSMSGFVGARLSLRLGPARTRRLHAGLTLAPMTQARQSDGSLRTRFGEGLEFGVSGDDKVGLSFAPLARLSEGKAGPNGRKAGVSTIGWVAIGVGTVAVVVLGAYALCASETICNFDDE
jgi:hypothetical protein